MEEENRRQGPRPFHFQNRNTKKNFVFGFRNEIIRKGLKQISDSFKKLLTKKAGRQGCCYVEIILHQRQLSSQVTPFFVAGLWMALTKKLDSPLANKKFSRRTHAESV
jgi:hypothetical protein